MPAQHPFRQRLSGLPEPLENPDHREGVLLAVRQHGLAEATSLSGGEPTAYHLFISGTGLAALSDDRVKRGELGYPICAGCRATRSPYASDSDLGHFHKRHRERCGKEPGRLGLHAETTVDGLLFAGLSSQEETVNLGEALRRGRPISSTLFLLTRCLECVLRS